jgi:hypothetical protein
LDVEREEYLRNERIRLLRFTNEQVLNDLPFVLDTIRKHLPANSPPPVGEEPEVGVSAEEGSGVEAYTIEISLPENLAQHIVPKGSLALDGVALTVAEIRGKNVTVALIPHTLEETTLGGLRKGDRVNVETDILGRYVRSFQHSQ